MKVTTPFFQAIYLITSVAVASIQPTILALAYHRLCNPAFLPSSRNPRLSSISPLCKPPARRPLTRLLTEPPFALFAITKLLPSTMNAVLQSAHDDPSVNTWWWYLPSTLSYSLAPQRKPDGTGQIGTPTPLPPSFSSPFIGKSLEDIVKWLRDKPPNVDLDDRFFGVLDREAAVSGKVAICRLNDPKVEKVVAWCILRDAGYSALYLAGLDSNLDWNEDVEYGKYTLNP